MTEMKHRPRRSAWKGRTFGFLAVLLLLAGILYVAQDNGTISVAQRNDSATTSSTNVPTPEARSSAESTAPGPAGAAATTGSSPTE